MGRLTKQEIEEVNERINDLINLHRAVDDDRFKLTRNLKDSYRNKEGYKRSLEFQIKNQLGIKHDDPDQIAADFDLLRSQLRSNKIHKEDSFKQFYNLTTLIEQDTFGLYEPIKISGIDTELVALIDSGNSAYNVIHGVDIKEIGDQVQFTTHNNIILTKDKVDEITIHVGAGNDEHRPVVEFDKIEIAGRVYPDVRFSVGDRTENQHPVLIGVDFLKQIGALIDVNK